MNIRRAQFIDRCKQFDLLGGYEPMKREFTEVEVNRIIEMAWEDRTPFEAIELQFSLKENEVRSLMRSHLKRRSFVVWRTRVKGRKAKHLSMRPFTEGRFRSSNQRA